MVSALGSLWVWFWAVAPVVSVIPCWIALAVVLRRSRGLLASPAGAVDGASAADPALRVWSLLTLLAPVVSVLTAFAVARGTVLAGLADGGELAAVLGVVLLAASIALFGIYPLALTGLVLSARRGRELRAEVPDADQRANRRWLAAARGASLVWLILLPTLLIAGFWAWNWFIARGFA